MANGKIILEISEAIRLCKQAGYEPVALLINPKISDMLSEEPKDHQGVVTFNKIFGLTVFEHPGIKDFYLVDNRSWADQRW